KQGNFSSARQKVNQIKQAGGDTTSLATKIDQAEAAEQARKQHELNYQQTVQKYKQAFAANDKSGIDGARDSFLLIAQGGGLRAADARKYISEINEKNTTAQLAAAPPAKPGLPATRVADEASLRTVQESEKKGIQAALDSFNRAFEDQQPRELKEIWPGATDQYLKVLRPPAGSRVVMMLQPTGEPSISGDTALLACYVNSETTVRGNRTTNRKAVKVHLRKAGDRWLISDPFGQ
ncbi:MAG: hypothetical protein ACRD23_00275, partial [Terriglobales bacterium]